MGWAPRSAWMMIAFIVVSSVGAALSVPPLSVQHVHTQTSQQHVVGRFVVRVQRKAVALEALHNERALGQLFAACRRERVPDDRQPAVLLAVLEEASRDAVDDPHHSGALALYRSRRGAWR